MTPKQKQLKLQTIRALITGAGFTPDSYGNYKHAFEDCTYRIKLKPINIRIERKLPGNPNWYKVTSQPIVNIDIQKLTNWIAKFYRAKETNK